MPVTTDDSNLLKGHAHAQLPLSSLSQTHTCETQMTRSSSWTISVPVSVFYKHDAVPRTLPYDGNTCLFVNALH